MGLVDLAEMLRVSSDDKINKIRRQILDTYIRIEVDGLQAQIMALQSVQGRIQDLQKC
jgi:hypothetical protein